MYRLGRKKLFFFFFVVKQKPFGHLWVLRFAVHF